MELRELTQVSTSKNQNVFNAGRLIEIFDPWAFLTREDAILVRLEVCEFQLFGRLGRVTCCRVQNYRS